MLFDTSNLIVFTLAGIALNLTPGPDMLFVATRALGQGRSAGVVSALGIGGGSIVHTIAAAAGLSALLAYSATAFLIVKYAGAAYLIYVGIQAIRTRTPLLSEASGGKHRPLPRLFMQGVMTNVLNPKVALFFLSFLPQFTDPSRGSVALQIVVLGMIFNTTGTIVNGLVGILSGFGRDWLHTRPVFWTVQRWFTGSVLTALGLRLALAEQK